MNDVSQDEKNLAIERFVYLARHAPCRGEGYENLQDRVWEGTKNY